MTPFAERIISCPVERVPAKITAYFEKPSVKITPSFEILKI